MARARPVQTFLPLPTFEADGVTHARGCECARCDTGFAPSDNARGRAVRTWEAAQQMEKLRMAAERALERKHEKERIKALRFALELEAGEKRTEAFLREQAAVKRRLAQDDALAALLAARRAGASAEEAVAQVERTRVGAAAKPSGGRN